MRMSGPAREGGEFGGGIERGGEYTRFYGAEGTGFEWLKRPNQSGSEGSYGPPVRQRCIATEGRAREEGRSLNYRVSAINTCGETHHPFDIDYPRSTFFKPSLDAQRVSQDDGTRR